MLRFVLSTDRLDRPVTGGGRLPTDNVAATSADGSTVRVVKLPAALCLINWLHGGGAKPWSFINPAAVSEDFLKLNKKCLLMTRRGFLIEYFRAFLF